MWRYLPIVSIFALFVSCSESRSDQPERTERTTKSPSTNADGGSDTLQTTSGHRQRRSNRAHPLLAKLGQSPSPAKEPQQWEGEFQGTRKVLASIPKTLPREGVRLTVKQLEDNRIQILEGPLRNTTVMELTLSPDNPNEAQGQDEETQERSAIDLDNPDKRVETRSTRTYEVAAFMRDDKLYVAQIERTELDYDALSSETSVAELSRVEDVSAARSSGVTILAQGLRPGRFAVDDTQIYWIEHVYERNFVRESLLLAMPRAGGEPKTLASGLRSARSLAVGPTHVYLADIAPPYVVRVPIDGGEPELVVTFVPAPNEFLVDANNLYTITCSYRTLTISDRC